MKIAYIMITGGLEYDDRIRKEMMSMKKLLGDVEFKIFGFHGDNRSESGVLSYGVPYELVSLKNRGGKKSVIAMLRKEYDLYKQIAPKVKNYDMLWICDDQPFFFPLLSNKPMIWDLHEIPASIIGGKIKNALFHRMERRCKWLIHANQDRKEYLIRTGVLKQPGKSLVLRNYPDNYWLSEGERLNESYMKFKEWLNDNEYVYIQGLGGKARYAYETLSSIMEAHCMKAVIIGGVPENVKDKIAMAYPDVNNYIYYTGQIVQSETAAFIAHCKFSIVFYKMGKPNNTYCEPNRMFQCLGLGKPVIVGCNEPMRKIVEQYNNGIALNTDGGDVAENVEGIKQIMMYFTTLKNNAEINKGNFSWESQYPVFDMLFRKC